MHGVGCTGGQFIGMQAAVNVHFADRECTDRRHRAAENAQLGFFYIVTHLLESAQPAEGGHRAYLGVRNDCGLSGGNTSL